MTNDNKFAVDMAQQIRNQFKKQRYATNTINIFKQYLFIMIMCPKLPLALINFTLSRMQTHAEITFTSIIFLKSSVLPSENGQTKYV